MSQMDSKLFGTLNRVTATVDKVEGIVNKVTVTDSNSELIDKIKADIASIRLNIATLKSFFDKMKTQMSSFLALAESEPAKAFETMEKFGGGGDDSKAAKAADNLVNAFENLEKNIEALVAAEGS